MENNKANDDTKVVYSFNDHSRFIKRVEEVSTWLMERGHSGTYRVIDRTSSGTMEYSEFTSNREVTCIRELVNVHSDQHEFKRDQYDYVWNTQKGELIEWGVELPIEPYYIGWFSGDNWQLKFLLFAPVNVGDEKRLIVTKFASMEDAITFRLSV